MEFHFETRYRYIIAGNEKRIYDEKRKKRKEEAERRKREMEQRMQALTASMENLAAESRANHLFVAPTRTDEATNEDEDETQNYGNPAVMTSEKAEQIKTSLKEAADRDTNFGKRNIKRISMAEEAMTKRKKVEHMNYMNLKKHSL